MKSDRSAIIPFLFLSILALLVGLWAGLIRLGWPIPVLTTALPLQHGPIMISGFLGTLISLERVAALGRRWMFAAPLCSGSGWVLSLAFSTSLAGPLLITLGSFFATIILIVIVRKESKIYTLTMAVGMFSWLIGNVLWISGAPIYKVVWVWAAFLILTIAGERLELSRVLNFKVWHHRLFALAAGIFLFGVALRTQYSTVGTLVTGAGLLALAAWLVRFDIARRNLRHPSALTRFIATCLFCGYLWLGISGALNLVYGPQVAGPLYDAQLHSVFVGFVFSMIFGHALIILPALTRVHIPFRQIFYLPLILLHLSMAMRILSDLASWQLGRTWGGLINEVAIISFIGVMAGSVIKQKIETPHAVS